MTGSRPGVTGRERGRGRADTGVLGLGGDVTGRGRRSLHGAPRDPLSLSFLPSLSLSLSWSLGLAAFTRSLRGVSPPSIHSRSGRAGVRRSDTYDAPSIFMAVCAPLRCALRVRDAPFTEIGDLRTHSLRYPFLAHAARGYVRLLPWFLSRSQPPPPLPCICCTSSSHPPVSLKCSRRMLSRNTCRKRHPRSRVSQRGGSRSQPDGAPARTHPVPIARSSPNAVRCTYRERRSRIGVAQVAPRRPFAEAWVGLLAEFAF